MKRRGLLTIVSFSVIFFFIPSLAVKIWEYIVWAPWQAKSWLVYLLLALLILGWARRRISRTNRTTNHNLERPLILIAKERLVKGEISLEEFREIRQELK